jgi:NADH-quinone oxidoreductase subunit N
MVNQIPDFLPAMAEIAVLVMICVALLGELFLGRCVKNIAYIIVQLTLVFAFVLSSFQLGLFRVTTFNGLFVSDDISTLLKSVIYLTAFLSFFYGRHYIDDRKMPRGEFYLLGLISVLGMMVLVSAHSLLTLYLGLELMSLPLYAMIALRRDSMVSSEASLKYFVMGAVASGMLLYGMSMLYGATGSLDISVIAAHVASSWQAQHMLLSFAIVFLVAGISFKLAVVPFHMWAPDVYHGSPSAVTIFLSSAPKLAALGMAYRLLVFALPAAQVDWQQLLIIVSLLSVILGNVFAIAQSNIKRMLAYSGIGHMGYVLFGLVAGTSEGYSAALFYILIYGLMSVASFSLVVIMSRAGFEAENISDFKGLSKRSPWLAFMMLLVMLSMAGVPPLIGFFSKMLIFKALLNAGFVWLSVVGLLFAVVGAYYYLRVIKTMYFEEPDLTEALVINKDLTFVFSLNALALLGLGLFPNAIVYQCLQAFLS